MKTTSKLVALALALAVGAASAAAPVAGTKITNQATVDFSVTDQAGATTTGTSTSNIVTTTVVGVPSYTVVTNDPDKTVPAGTTVTYQYTVTNTGNTNLTITLAETTGTATPTTLTLTPNDGVTGSGTDQAVVTVTYTVPANAAGGTTYTHTLTATALSDTAADGTADETFATATQTAQNITTVLTPTPTTPGGPVNNDGTPSTTTTTFPSDPTNGEITPSPTVPGTGTGDGYTSGTTPITVDPTGNQTAYPKADGNTDPDVVELTGSIPNTSPQPIDIKVGPATDPDGTGPITVRIVDPATGEPFTDGATINIPDGNGGTVPVTVTVNPDGSVIFNNVPTGAIPQYAVEITYPDSDSTAAPTAPISVSVPITSGGDTLATPVYTVKTPGVDLKVVAQDSGTTLDASGQTVTPSTTTTTNADFTTTVQNTGDYGDVFNITQGTVNNLPTGATVEYLLNGTALSDTNGDGVIDTGLVDAGATATITTRVVVPANAPAAKDYSVTTVATGAFSTATDTDGTRFDIGIVAPPTSGTTDPNDPTYTSNPLFPISKTASTANAAPGEAVNYTITGKNLYNAPACGVIFKEINGGNTNFFTNSTYQGVSGTSSTGSLLFSTDSGSTWSATAPTGGTNPTSLWIGVNTNGDSAITAADCLPSQGTVSITLNTTVNK